MALSEKALEAAVASAWNRDPNTSDEAAVAYIVRAYLTALTEDEETVERVAEAIFPDDTVPWPRDRPRIESIVVKRRDMARAALKALTGGDERLSEQPCSKPRCCRPATIRREVYSWWLAPAKQTPVVYEVCQKHDAEFFEPHFDREKSERVKQKLRPIGAVEAFVKGDER